MNARALNALAGVICRAQESGKRTPMGIAIAVESAGLLMSPETAAELERLRARIAELEAEAYGNTEAWLLTSVEQIRHLHAAVAAQMSRANTLNRLCREYRKRAYGAEARVAELEAAQAPAELTVYRASHESIVMGLYTTREAAREHCETLMHREQSVADLNWYPDTTEGDDEDAPEGLFMVVAGEESDTGYVVTPVPVASEYDAEADE